MASISSDEADSAVREHGSIRAAAAATGVSKSTLQRKRREGVTAAGAAAAEALERAEPKQHWTRVEPDGEILRQTVHGQIPADSREDAVQAALDEIRTFVPRAAPAAAPAGTDDKLLNHFVISDAHIDMLAHADEGGDNWDHQISERVILGAFEQMLERCPRAGTAVIAELGDVIHADGHTPVTPTSGNVLDRSTRHQPAVRLAIKILRTMIDRALETHSHVHVVGCEGNHDLAFSAMLREMMSALYEDEPRVTVDATPSPYTVYRHGRVMLAHHHGHLKKPNALTSTFAAEFPAIWGATRYRYAHCGHLHHERVREDPGMIVRQHPTLAARDAHAARHGWSSQRGAEAETYHADHGLVGTVTVRPEMIPDRENKG